MGYDSYAQLYNLEEITFHAGQEYSLNCTVYEEDGVTPVSLNAATISWVMSHYGLDGIVASRSIGNGITVTGTNTFTVLINSASTKDLEQGKYKYQIQITDHNGSLFIPGQGLITLGAFIQ